MAGPGSLERHAQVLRDVVGWLESQKVPYCVIGGVAASVVGEARPTADVDLVVMPNNDDWSSLVSSAPDFGLTPRRADAIEFARRARVLLLRHAATKIGVDLSLGALAFEQECVDRAVPFTLCGVTVRVATPEDLVVMKALPGRDRDWRDIGGLLDANPRMDLRRVRRHLRSLADALETPDILDQFEAFIARRRKRKR